MRDFVGGICSNGSQREKEVRDLGTIPVVQGPRDERGGLELLLGRTLLESYFIAPFTLRSIAEIVFE